MTHNKPYFTAALITVLVLGFLATSVVSYFVAHDAISKRIAEESLPLTSDNIYSEVERDLLRSILISSLMAHDTFVRDWALSGEESPERIVRYLGEIQRKYQTTTAFFVSDKTRRYYHPSGIIKTVDPDDPADAWYFRVRRMNDPYEINVDHDTADPSRLSIFVNYRVTGYKGDYLGATGIGLSVSAVTDLIKTYQRRYGRQIFFMDREGAVTVHGSGFTGAKEIHQRPGMDKFATRLLTSPSTSITYAKETGETVYVNSRLVPELDWYLVVEQEGTKAEGRLLDTLLLNILIALLITALVLVVAWFTVRGYQGRLEEMATTDKLTGAANRHVFEAIYNQITTAAKRRGETVSIISLDLDHFKEINDSYGHQQGDAVLRSIAEIIRAHIREADTLCRWGGDEFLVLLSGCGAGDAEATACKIREAVRGRAFGMNGDQAHVSLSFGVASHRPGEGLEELIQRADNALYDMKRRNRTAGEAA